MKLTLQCKHCGNRMLYEPKSKLLSKLSKQCVYCGKSFRVVPAIRNTTFLNA